MVKDCVSIMYKLVKQDKTGEKLFILEMSFVDCAENERKMLFQNDCKNVSQNRIPVNLNSSP